MEGIQAASPITVLFVTVMGEGLISTYRCKTC